MTTSTTTLCACPSCSNPPRPKSIYCSKFCRDRAARIKKEDYNASYHEAHNRKPRMIVPESSKVTIFDPKCADGYKIPKSEYLMYAGKYLPGTRIIMDGQEITL